MKKLLLYVTLLLAGLTACNQDSVSPIDELRTQMSEQPDTVCAPGIYLNLEDSTLTEDIEEIVYHPKD